MKTNDYALKFAREKYEDAVRAGTSTPDELKQLKTDYDREREIYFSKIHTAGSTTRQKQC